MLTEDEYIDGAKITDSRGFNEKMNEYVDMAGGNMTFSGSESFEVEITLPRGENKV